MRKIKNFDELNESPLRQDLLKIIEAGLEKIDTPSIVKENFRLNYNHLQIKDVSFDLGAVQDVYLVGVGKCSLSACQVVQEILGKKLKMGIVVDPTCEKPFNEDNFKCFRGDHPLPTEVNVGVTKEIISLLEKSTDKDLILFVISGGGTVILCQPDNFTYQSEADLIQDLFHKGANIKDLNIVRKHLSLARGGFLAKYAYPSKVASMIFSDVPGDDLSFVSSGPTIQDQTTVEDAVDVLRRFDLLENGISLFNLIETPKEEKYFRDVQNILLVSNTVALKAMSDKADDLGYNPEICGSCLAGEARAIGERIVKEINQAPSGSVRLYGGETTVLVHNPKGKGGRNMEVALSGLRSVVDESIIVASVASDGRDNTEYAGAICDRVTQNNAKTLKLNPLDYLDNNNSFEFFQKTGDYIQTGSTGSNVSDLLIVIKNQY